MDLWDWSLENVKLTEMKGRINGAKSKMKTFDFLFGCVLGKTILKQTDNLSKSLQSPTLSAAEGQEIAQDVVMTLEKDRNVESFNLFWKRLEQRRLELTIPPAQLPRKRKMPNYFASTENPSTQHHHDSVKDHYRSCYFEAFDYTVQGIKDRFNQGDFKRYSMLQQLILKAVNGESYEEEFEFLTTFWNNDFKKSLLETQLPTVQISLCSEGKLNISEAISKIKSLSRTRKNLLSEVTKVVKLLLVMPATNAISERSFSALKRVKTYLRATMTDNRLNNLMTLHVHKSRTDHLDLISVGNIFVNQYDERKDIFGHFKQTDIVKKTTLKDASTQTL